MTETILLEGCYKKSDRFVSRVIAGEAVLIPFRSGKDDIDLNYIYSLNETASTTWNMLDGSHTLRSIVEQIVTEYEAEETDVIQDVVGLIREFLQMGAVIKV